MGNCKLIDCIDNENTMKSQIMIENKREKKFIKKKSTSQIIENGSKELVILDYKEEEDFNLIKNKENINKILNIINKIRNNPKEYIKEIKENKKYIIPFSKNYFIFCKNNFKIALNKGIEAFESAINDLNSRESMSNLVLKNEIIIKIPENENELNDVNYFKNQTEIIKKKMNIDVYFKDYINEPEISILLMIIDDIWNDSHDRRNAILNKDFNYIGINYNIINGKYIAYFSFSKEKNKYYCSKK